ncbi:calcium-activated chloride channel regulator 1-like isoform X1 [Ostrea edulis]|uniref:calcium-activated chloride channel regulator 1-like isoform X1 n=1 Tax=Ostrea edulis TaxID=37623 RepID=UPI0024AF9450|nr:calcium-activated chloride channel regulator 1-like isoform X1 [Ostrea edulis]
MGWLRLAVIFCSFVYVCSLDSQSHLKISNNGYQLLVVAIHNNVPDNPALLEKIKTTLTKASKVLYSATRKRAYFQKVFFLLPSSWSNRPQYKPATSVKITGADIIFSAPRSATRRSFSHTKTYAGCGHKGIHSQLLTDVLSNSHPLAQSSPEKYIIHEFAKLRYGVFDEYPSPGENEFYFSTTFGRLDPIRCTVGLRGIIRGPSGYCLFTSIDPETGEFPAGCKYIPYPYRANGTASMMDHQYVREIKDFCDDDHTPGHFSHNVEPPNRHNRLCSHRSTWDVISKTPDFLNNANPPTTLSDQQLTPQFIIFRAPSRRRRRLAVVLDSPQEVHRRLRLHQAVDHFLREGFDADTRVAVIHNGADRIDSGRMRSRRSTVIKAILENINQNYTSSSTIQSRIQSGVEILRKGNLTKPGLELHLVVFNCANQSNMEEDLQNLSDLDITPHVIHCGGDGTKQTEDIVTQQGGLVESKDHRSIFYAVQRLSDKLHDEKEQSIQILNENLEIGETTYKGEFTLDETLHGELVLRIHYNSSPPSVRVFSPNESEYGLQTIDTKLRYIRFTIPISEKEHGKWSLSISNNSPQKENMHVIVVIRPRSREDEAAIRTQAWVKMFNEYSPPRVGLYAEVMYGGHPVVNAHVTAHVYQNNRNVAAITLRDTGGGLDIMKEDGIYSNSFTEMESHGNHYVEIVIEDIYNKTEIHRTHEIQIPPEKGFFPDDHDMLHAPRLKHITEKIKLKHGLKRSTSTEHFEIDPRWDLKPEIDHYPPARIIDLHVGNVSRKNRTVFLSWTATGENLDTGRANSYEIRYHTNGTKLLLSPKDAWQVTKENVVRGKLDRPKEAGQIEHVAIQFPHTMKWTAIMLRSVDQHNSAGEFSNMVTALFEL